MDSPSLQIPPDVAEIIARARDLDLDEIVADLIEMLDVSDANIEGAPVNMKLLRRRKYDPLDIGWKPVMAGLPLNELLKRMELARFDERLTPKAMILNSSSARMLDTITKVDLLALNRNTEDIHSTGLSYIVAPIRLPEVANFCRYTHAGLRKFMEAENVLIPEAQPYAPDCPLQVIPLPDITDQSLYDSLPKRLKQLGA